MSKKVIKIDADKCIGCGLCAATCKQSAIEMIDGKAVVTSEDYCDGIGNCLRVCPVNAISFSDKDVSKSEDRPKHSTCPGSRAKMISSDENVADVKIKSALRQWPVQIKLIPESAPYFENADLLIAADCSAFAYANFHAEFIKDKITIIGCPKLDSVDYTNKLSSIINNNSIKSVTVVRMEVPCCGGIENAAVNAVKNSGKKLPLNVVTITINGEILKNKKVED